MTTTPHTQFSRRHPLETGIRQEGGEEQEEGEEETEAAAQRENMARPVMT